MSADRLAAPVEQPGEDGHDVSITLYEDGPLIVRGPVALRTMDGEVIEPGRETVALCRCGRSGLKPFCDGTHARTKFSATGVDERDTRRGATARRFAPSRPQATAARESAE